MRHHIRIDERLERVAPAGRDQFLPLFSLADDSESQVRSYYRDGELFVLRGPDGTARGITLSIPHQTCGAELKAVAVDPTWQRRGVGRRMLAAVFAELRAAGVRRVVVGTGNSSIGALAFYQKAGFRLSAIERDVFTPARGYRDRIVEYGIVLRDMIWFEREL